MRFERFAATFAVPSCGRVRVADLTDAVLYKATAEPYYPLALLLWREKFRQLFR